MATIKTILAIATQNKWHVYQIDFKSKFLKGYLDEEIECIEKNQTWELVDVPKD